MLSNAYFLAKFRFDTAENEPAKNLQIFEKCIFEKCIFEAENFTPGNFVPGTRPVVIALLRELERAGGVLVVTDYL